MRVCTCMQALMWCMTPAALLTSCMTAQTGFFCVWLHSYEPAALASLAVGPSPTASDLGPLLPCSTRCHGAPHPCSAPAAPAVLRSSPSTGSTIQVGSSVSSAVNPCGGAAWLASCHKCCAPAGAAGPAKSSRALAMHHKHLTPRFSVVHVWWVLGACAKARLAQGNNTPTSTLPSRQCNGPHLGRGAFLPNKLVGGEGS